MKRGFKCSVFDIYPEKKVFPYAAISLQEMLKSCEF